VILIGGQQFSSSLLSWDTLAPTDPTQVSLLDSGTNDFAPQDGLFTGSFIPATPGQYVAVMRATGLSNTGTPFSRTSATEFTVTPLRATLGAVTASVVDDNGNSLWDHLRIAATADVTAAGAYTFSASLRASNGNVVNLGMDATLGTGPTQVQVNFPAAEIN